MKNKKDKIAIRLPIKTDPSITSECWTFYKLSIIETSRCADMWLATHLSLYYDNDYHAYFGKNDTPFYLEYYNDILEYEEIPIETIEPKDILQIVIDEINNGYYVALYLPHPTLTIHEIVIHGFDEKKEELYYNTLINGKFTETIISFDSFKQEHDKVYVFFKNHPFSRVVTSWYFFPITRLKPKDYKDDICELKAINKLKTELEVNKMVISSNEDNGDCKEKIYYTGFGCFWGFENRLKEYIRDKKYIKGDIFTDLALQLVNTIFKFYEYINNLLNTMKWISSRLGGEELLSTFISFFEKELNNMNKMYMLALKFLNTENWELFDKIFKGFKNIYCTYSKKMSAFCDEASELLYSFKSFMN